MKQFAPYIVVAILIALAFFTGKCNTSRAYDQVEVDRLNARVGELEQIQGHHARDSRDLYKAAMDERSAKLFFEQRYNEQLKANSRLTKTEKDLKAKLSLKVGSADSSRFTEPVVDAILTQGAENEMLEDKAEADSLAFETLEDAYVALDSALIVCDERVDSKDQIIDKLKIKNRKPHWWEWPLVGAAVIIGFLLGAQ